MGNEMVVKVGGSLYDMPGLGKLLQGWLFEQATRRVLIVPGGGLAADLVRQADALDRLGEERGHWLALRSLTLTAHLLAARLPGGTVIADISTRERAWRQSQLPILDMHAFALADENQPYHLPHLWQASSDSLALRVAMVGGISELTLLKSCDGPHGQDWIEAARRGIVDALFPELLKSAGGQVGVRLVNFRRWLAAAASAAPGRDHEP